MTSRSFRWRSCVLFVVVVVVVVSCQSLPPDPATPHHGVNKFNNPHSHDPHGPQGWYALPDFLKWRWQRLMAGAPERDDDAYQVTLADNDPAYLKSNGQDPTLTWIGHATLLLQLNGVNILTDPHLTERSSPVSWAGTKRLVPPGLDFEDLPEIHVVVISHNHYDHLDLPTLRRLSQQWGPERSPRIFVPLGIKALLESENIPNVVEMDWWDQERYKGLSIHAVPAQHYSRRTPFDGNRTLWASFAIISDDYRFLFVGDSGYSPDFEEIGERFGPFDLAAIPIGHYAPRWYLHAMHLDPEEAVLVHRDVRARCSVAIHWGTFPLPGDDPLDEPPKRLRAALLEAGISQRDFSVMQHGETRHLHADTCEGEPKNTTTRTNDK